MFVAAAPQSLDPSGTQIPNHDLPSEGLMDDVEAGLAAATSRRAYARMAAVGKSLGTRAMAELVTAGRLPPSAATVWLTPVLADPCVRAALDAAAGPRLLVIGDADPYHDPALLDRLRDDGFEVLVLAGADLGLNVGTDHAATFRSMERYTSDLAAFLGRAWT